MLSVPVRGDGTIDDHEVAFLEGMAEWMKTNGEGIFGSRPWKVYGEGPSTVETPEAGQFGGARDVRSKPYTIEDIRFTNKRRHRLPARAAAGGAGRHQEPGNELAKHRRAES